MLTDDLKRKIQDAYSHWLESKSFKPRYGQRLMIADVAKTLARSSCDADGHREGDAAVCVMEAGTGTGKTIAYALAAIPIAKALDKKLVISTATIALQEQIIYKDLPDVLRHSGLSFSFSLAKGRGRYLCLTKLDGVLQESEASNQAMALYPDELTAVDQQELKVYENMTSALTAGDWDGDRDSWSEEIDGQIWSRVTTDHAQCTGRRCANISQCCFYKARESIVNDDVIVTNHDLVLSDLALGGGAILPDPEDTIYIFDEGHHLPDKAINHFAQFSRVHSTERWLDQVSKVLAKAAPVLGSADGIHYYMQQLPAIVDQLKQKVAALFNYLENVVGMESDERGSAPCHRYERGIIPNELLQQANELSELYNNLRDLLGTCCKILEDSMEESGGAISRSIAEEWFPALSMMRDRSESNYALWSDYSRADKAEDPPRGRWVAVVEGAGGHLDFEVYSSPIMGAKTLERFLWSRCFSAVVTSATLTALGRFDRFTMHSGVPASTHFNTVPSPFDYHEAGELVIPVMTCDPSDPNAHTDELIDLLPTLLARDGGSLVLFASKRQMENVYEGLDSQWQQRILMQGDFPKHEILRLHKAAIDNDDGSVIFGLASFAEGVDLPGAYCTHVIIAKIPFAVPDQPIESALAEWVESRGGNPFMDITVPDAAVKLVQASGRLLRSETDKGRVTLLDRRIVSRRYGQAMLESLPPFRRVVF